MNRTENRTKQKTTKYNRIKSREENRTEQLKTEQKKQRINNRTE